MSFKKTTLVLLVSASQCAFSGAMGPICDSSNVKTPCANHAWELSGQALYLQTNSTSSQLNSGVTQSDGHLLNYSQPWNWGFRLDAAYQYGQANDIDINWSHLSQSSQRAFTGPFVIDQLYTHPASSSGLLTSKPTWDNVNIEMGQTIILNDSKTVRFHGGVDYVRVDNTNIRTVDAPVDVALYQDARTTSYNGFGPRVGFDFNYIWNQGVHLYVNAAAGLLAGTAKSGLDDLDTVAGVSTRVSGGSSMSRIVPELESKLGIKYDYTLAQGHLIADVGWMWLNYFNAQSSFLTGQQTVSIEDFGIQGLYFGLKWHGDLA